MLATPKYVAVEHESRHAEDAGLLGLVLNAVEFGTAGSGLVIEEAFRLDARFRQQSGDGSRIFGRQFTPEEAFEGQVVNSMAINNRRVVAIGENLEQNTEFKAFSKINLKKKMK